MVSGPGEGHYAKPGLAAEVESFDFVVVGSGPAGMAAATEAMRRGLSTLVLDEQQAAGGQIYRGIEAASDKPAHFARLGADYQHGRTLATRLRDSGAVLRYGALVWEITKDRRLTVSREGRSTLVHAGQILLATGALERPVPIPGWTLPGVMTAGAAQILLKTAGQVPAGRAVLAGSGPLLYLLAAQLIDAGARPVILVETQPANNWMRALPHLPRALRNPALLKKGLALLKTIRGAGISRFAGATDLEALAGEDGRLSALSFMRRGRRVEVECDLLLLHEGVIPNMNLALTLGCASRWSDARLAFEPETDEWFHSSVEGVAIAGDGAGIEGAQAAEQQGRIAALGAAMRLGRISKAEAEAEAVPAREALAGWRGARPFVEALYRPADGQRIPSRADVIVCRCEEVTVGDIREAVATGALGPNQAKAFTRCGMGPCQGRMCGPTVTALIGQIRGVPPEEVGYYRLRPPLKPIPLAEIAAMAVAGGERQDAIRDRLPGGG